MDKDKAEEDIQPQNFKIEKLPDVARRHLFKFLNSKDQRCMRQLCKGLQSYIEYDYGIHAYFSPRYATDRMWTDAFQALEGKVIRSLEVNEMHRDVNPLPLDKIIQYPWRLKWACLRYVDVGLIIALLSSYRNLSEFHYTTSMFPEGGDEPVLIPTEKEELIEFLTQLPPLTFQVDKLTMLSLRLQKVNPALSSDWANVVFLLLALSQRNLGSLRTFKFDFASKECLNSTESLEILACMGQFLGQCPNLRKLEYSSGEWAEDDVYEPLPMTVFSGMIKKYGSAQLKELDVAEGLGLREGSLEQIKLIMRDAGMNLRNLQAVDLLWCSRVEPELFQILLSALPSPSMRKIDICDKVGQSFTNGAYDLLLGQREDQSTLPLYGNLETLCIYRPHPCYSNFAEEDDPNGALSLPRMLRTMRALKHFVFVPRKLDFLYQRRNGNCYYEYTDRNDFGTVDVTFEDGDVHFQSLQGLKMEGVKISPRDAARLIELRNLEKLVLIVHLEPRPRLYGMKSKDLLRLLGKLRKLEKVWVNKIQFPLCPEEDKTAQCGVLQKLGKLGEMVCNFSTSNLRGANLGWDYEHIAQYFTLGF